MCRRCESIISSPLSSKHSTQEHTLVSFNSRTSVFQTDDGGAIPSTRSQLGLCPSLREPPREATCSACIGLAERRFAPRGTPGSRHFVLALLSHFSSRISDEERGLQNRV